ncbi:MAG: hypothetical protein EP317_00610 [Bacillota bacterium]|nr:MAG: hypothetical protein EP317_00610 [Bacillota bacterium]
MENMMQDKYDLYYKKSAFFYIAYVGLFLACAIVILGAYQILFGTIRNEDGVILTLNDQLPFFIPFIIVGATWLYSFIQMTLKLLRSTYTFKISDEGFHDVLTGGIFLAFVFMMPIKFIPFSHIDYDDSGLMPQFKVKKENLKSYPLYTRFVMRLKGIKITLLYAKLDESFAKFLKEKYIDKDAFTDLDAQNIS